MKHALVFPCRGAIDLAVAAMGWVIVAMPVSAMK